MPDAARIAQAQALEVPIILQGAHDAGESGRELFTENATTILVFDNGAVLNARSRLTVGQTVFIHNTQNGREVLCKVMEAPLEGETGYTDLEFTTPAPDFWNADSHADQQAEAPVQDSETAEEQPGTHEQHKPAPTDDTLAMMHATAPNIDVPSMTAPNKESGVPDSNVPLREELMAAHEMAPDPSAAPVPVPDFEPATTTNSRATEPTGEQIDAALKQMSGATPAAAPLDAMEPENPQDEKHIAALMARDARLAKFAAFKEKQAQQTQKDASAKEAGKGAANEASDGSQEVEAASNPKSTVMELSLLDRLTAGKNATYLTIAAGVLITVAIGFVWHAIQGAFVHPSEPSAAVAPAQPSPSTNPASTAPAAYAANSPAGTREPNTALARPWRSEMRTAPSPEDVGNTPQGKHRRVEAGRGVIEPALVLWQPQPTLPPWAAGMQIDGVVTLDALIDEKGNVAETRVLSGPRALQRAAERAVALWVFEPARSDGKGIPSHLTLSVRFLPPLQPKR